MLLVGRYASPFVRRVGVSLKILGLGFEQKAVSTIQNRAEVEAFNPLGRVPALVLADGEVLIDSTPILDYLDELVGPERALVPPSGAARRQVLRLVAYGMGAMEKTLACFIERTLRPVDTRHQALLERFVQQALAGLEQLDRAVPDGGWLYGGKVTQADISAVAAMDFLRQSWPEMLPAGRLPRLDALRDRAYALPAFSETVA